MTTETSTASSGLYPAQAQAQIDAKMADHEFKQRYLNSDILIRGPAMAELEPLFQAASGGAAPEGPPVDGQEPPATIGQYEFNAPEADPAALAELANVVVQEQVPPALFNFASEAVAKATANGGGFVDEATFDASVHAARDELARQHGDRAAEIIRTGWDYLDHLSGKSPALEKAIEVLLSKPETAVWALNSAANIAARRRAAGR